MASSIHFNVVDPTGDAGWDDRIALHPGATVFHTSAWASILSDTYGYTPIYFVAQEEGKIIALLPFMEIRSWLTGIRGVSLPFTDECAPILPDREGFQETLRPILEHARSRRWKTIELRGRGRGMGNLPAAVEYLSHALDLTEGEELLSSRYSQNTRRNLRKAERGGISVEPDPSPKGLREFYRLNILTRREHGLPPQPYRFFESLREHVLAKGLGTLLLGWYGGKVVAGAVFLHFGKKAIYKYGASDPRYPMLRAIPLVFQEGIREMRSKGCTFLSFGRTDIEHEGLRRFKLSWGAKETRLQYVRFDMESGNWLFPQKSWYFSCEGAVSKMPVPVLRIVGELAYRHIG